MLPSHQTPYANAPPTKPPSLVAMMTTTIITQKLQPKETLAGGLASGSLLIFLLSQL
jgi:hypothetical protein